MAYTPYQPYDWETGEVITEGKLDHIEEGLVAAGEQIAENESDIAELNEQMPTKASIDQNYSDLGSGYTTTLKPTKYNKNQEPYLFRRALGARLTSEKIIGGTVAWNQLVQNGDFASTSGWTATGCAISVANNVCTLTSAGTASYMRAEHVLANPLIVGHKYLASCSYDFSGASDVANMTIRFIGATAFQGPATNINKGSYSTICSPSTANTTICVLFSRESGTITSGQSATAKNVILIDLTLAFGTTIADHIYALEQAQAGAGIAFLRNNGFMTKPYYPYCANSLESVMTSGHKTVGFNQWDEQWELGIYNYQTGLPVSSTTRIRSKNKIRVLGGQTYYCNFNNFGTDVFQYDIDGEWIKSDYVSASGDHLLTLESNTAYINFSPYAVYGITYNHDICINLSSDRNGEYEPYSEHLYPLSPVSLRGIMTLEDGKLKNDGDTYEPSGTVTRRYGLVDLGTLTWYYNSTYNLFTTGEIESMKSTGSSDVANIICQKYVTTSDYVASSDITLDKMVWIFTKNIRIRDITYTDEAAFKTAMSGVYLVYELASPTTETTDPYQSEQTCSEYGTESFIDTRDVPIPVGHVTDYWPDLTAKIEGLPDVTAIAPTENNATASQAYTAGQYFIRNNEFCKAKTNIASGATFTLNTNYEVTTIAAELYAALNS